MRKFLAKVDVFNGRYTVSSRHFTVPGSDYSIAANRAWRIAKKFDETIRKQGRRIERVTIHLERIKETKGERNELVNPVPPAA